MRAEFDLIDAICVAAIGACMMLALAGHPFVVVFSTALTAVGVALAVDKLSPLMLRRLARMGAAAVLVLGLDGGWILARGLASGYTSVARPTTETALPRRSVQVHTPPPRHGAYPTTRPTESSPPAPPLVTPTPPLRKPIMAATTAGPAVVQRAVAPSEPREVYNFNLYETQNPKQADAFYPLDGGNYIFQPFSAAGYRHFVRADLVIDCHGCDAEFYIYRNAAGTDAVCAAKGHDVTMPWHHFVPDGACPLDGSSTYYLQVHVIGGHVDLGLVTNRGTTPNADAPDPQPAVPTNMVFDAVITLQ